MNNNIIENKVRCLKCDDILISKYKGDQSTCSCGTVTIDGGNFQLKRYASRSLYEELSMFEESKVVKVGK